MKRHKKQYISILMTIALLTVLIFCTSCANKKPADATTAPTGSGTTEQTGEPTEETTGEATEETTVPPTTEPLTAENSLDLGKMQIVLPVDATDVEKTAADELVDYVNKMTGETLTIVTEGAAVDAGIYVGNTAFAQTNQVSYPATEYGEGWAIKVIGDDLVLCGEATRGTLYAVYHLLEDVLGVHWWNFAEEYVPSLENAFVPKNYDDQGAPAFKFRDLHLGGTLYNSENLFFVRNRVNGNFSNPPEGYGGKETFGQPSFVHSFSYYVPDSMFKTNPEWFSIVSGKRKEGSQLCLTNQELISYMKESLVSYIEKDIQASKMFGVARPRWYTLCPNDRGGFCECEPCQAVINQSGLSGYLLKFVNELASEVETKYPDVLIDTLAYWQYIEPPLDDTKPAKNVQIRFAGSPIDTTHSYAHPNNKEVLRYLKEWIELTEENQLFVWDYIVSYHVNGISPTMYRLPEHYQTLLELGVTGYFGELQNPINVEFWDMKLWLNAKMMENPYQDFDALMDTFLNGYYGAAGPYVKDYLDLVGGLLADSDTYVQFGQQTINPSWLTYDAAVDSDAYFDEAFKAADGDETLLRRLRLARNCLDRVILEKFDEYQLAAQEAGKDFNFDKKELCQSIVDCFNEQQELRKGEDSSLMDTLLPHYEDLLNSLG